MAYIDQILDTMQDFVNAAVPYAMEKHENKMKKVKINALYDFSSCHSYIWYFS